MQRSASVLMPDEEIQTEGHIHWWVMLVALSVCGVGLLTWLIGLIKGGRSILYWLPAAIQSVLPEQISAILTRIILYPTTWIGWLLSIWGFWLLYKAVRALWFTHITVTNKRLIARVGIFKRYTIEIPHARVDSLHVEQSLVGQILGFGTLIIQTSGGGRLPFYAVADPLTFRTLILSVITDPS